jgi:preprotein translocase subunit SecB
LPERLVDFAAAGRVASRVELKTIRVTDVSAKCDPKITVPLEPTLTVDCNLVSHDAGILEVACNYRFLAQAAGEQAAEATVRYLLVFDVHGSEPIAEQDLSEFAAANGTLHSWPFVREFLHGLTSRMGYPAYTLPVFHFKPKPPVKKEAESAPPAGSDNAPAHPKD